MRNINWKLDIKPSVSIWRPIKMVISLRLLSFLWPLLVSILASCLNPWSSNYNQLECIEIIFLCCWLLSKHIFGWLDISKTLRSCLNNFKWWLLLTDHDDVEGEEGATILVQLRPLLHRPPWASLMADAWFPTPFSTAESSTTPAILLHTLLTIKISI